MNGKRNPCFSPSGDSADHSHVARGFN
jgi:hypothetical protein